MTIPAPITPADRETLALAEALRARCATRGTSWPWQNVILAFRSNSA